MAKRVPRARPFARLHQSVEIEIHDAVLKPFGTLKHLDLNTLKKSARVEVELGHIEGGCCSQLVRAVVRRGMVTDIAIDRCPETTWEKAPVDLLRILNVVKRKAKAASRTKPPSFPIPVERFFANVALSVKGLVCYQVCLFGYCITCCTRTDIVSDWYCGRLTIDTTSGPYPE